MDVKPCCTLFRDDIAQFLRDTLCQEKDEWAKWCDWLSSPPLWTVLRVNSHKVSRSDAKTRLQDFLTEHCKTHCSGTEYTVSEHPALSDALVLSCPRASPAPQPTHKQVVVGLQCGVAVMRGADVFAPGVMAMDPAVQKGDTVSVFADIEGLCRRGVTKPFDGPLQFVGNGQADISRYALFHCENPSGVAVTMTQPVFTSPPLNGLHPDALFPQNLPSIVACHVLAPRPGETVLDMCAAPGGKTTHIASLMANSGVVVALDKSAARLKRLTENCERLGITCVRSHACDGRKSVAVVSAEQPTASASVEAPPFPPESFDRVLLDAPCSALGQRPQIRNSMSLKELQSFPAYQRQIFAKAVELLRPGGVLVYCTCTLTVQENEGQVAWALGRFPTLALQSQEPFLGQPGFVVDGLDRSQADSVQRFMLPAQQQSDDVGVNGDSIGFFVAKFVKKLV